MIGPIRTAPGGFNRVLVAIDKFTKWIEVKPVTFPKADRVIDFLDKLVHRYRLPYRIITNLGSNFNSHHFWNTARTAGSISSTSQLAIHGPTDNSSVPMGWNSTLSRSDCMTLLTQKGASGSMNYPTHSGGFVHSLPSQQGSHSTSWSTTMKLSYLPT
jgi:hypothetical protein